MEVGKKYYWGACNPQQTFKCVAFTPLGSAVLVNVKLGGEHLATYGRFAEYFEVKDSEVRYIHWYRHKDMKHVTTYTTSKEDPTEYAKLVYLKTDKVQYDG